MLTVFALDPGKTCGWACSDGTSGSECHEVASDRKVNATVRHGMLSRRFRRWLEGRLFVAQAGALVLERQMMGRGGGEVTLGLRMAALDVAAGLHVAVDEVWPGSWQPWAKRELGWIKHKKGGDEDDARALLAWWRAHREGRVS